MITESEPPVEVGASVASPLDALLPRLREAGTHTIIYGIGSALQAASGFILIPLYTRQFDPATYGVFALLTLIGTFGAAAFSLGGASSLARSYFDYKDEADRARVVATSIYIVAVGGLIATLLSLPLAKPLAEQVVGDVKYAGALRWMLVMSMLAQVVGVLLVLARFKRRSSLVVATNLAALVLTSGLIWYLLAVKHWGLMGPVAGMLASQVVQLCWFGWALRRDIALRGMWREVPIQLSYGLPAAAVGLLYYALDSIDRLLLQHMSGTAAVGVYSLGYRIAFIVNLLLVQPFSQIWNPMRMEYRSDEHAVRLYAVVLRYFVLVGLATSVIGGIFAREIVALIGGAAQYQEAYLVVGLVMLGYIAYGSLGIVDAGIIFARRVSYHAVNFAVALLVNVGLNYLLIPRFGIVGAATATLITYVFVSVVAAVLSNRLLPVPWDLGRLSLCAVTGILVLAAGLLIDGPTSTRLLVKALLGATSLAVFWFVGLTGEERGAVQRIVAWVGRRTVAESR